MGVGMEASVGGLAFVGNQGRVLSKEGHDQTLIDHSGRCVERDDKGLRVESESPGRKLLQPSRGDTTVAGQG